jgi:hypothetical protein
VSRVFIDIFLCSFADDASPASVRRLTWLRGALVLGYRALRRTHHDFAGLPRPEAARLVLDFLAPYQARQRHLLNRRGSRGAVCPLIITNHRTKQQYFHNYQTIFPLQRVHFAGFTAYAAHHPGQFLTGLYGGGLWDLPLDIGRHPRSGAKSRDFVLMRAFLASGQPGFPVLTLTAPDGP